MSRTRLIVALTVILATSLTAASVSLAQTPQVGSWTKGPALPVAVGGHNVVFHQGRLFSIGGTLWQGGSKRWIDTIYTWQPGQLQWTIAGELPRPLAYAVTSASPDPNYDLLLMGGGENNFAVAGIVGVKLGQVSTAQFVSTLPEPVTLAMGGLTDNTLVIAGGTADVGELATARNRTFAKESGREWSPTQSLHGEPRALAGYAVCGDELFVFGGCRQVEGRGAVNYKNCYAWSPSTGMWRRIADLPFSARGVAATTIDERYILLVGGYRDDLAGGQFANAVLIYDREKDKMATTTSLPVGVATAGVAVDGDNIYVVGGEDAQRSRVNHLFIGQLQH